MLQRGSMRRSLLVIAAAVVAATVAAGVRAAISEPAHFTLRGTVVRVVDGDTINSS